MTPERAFDEYNQAIFRFAYRMTHSASTAEDIAQECFLVLLRYPGRFDPAAGTMKTFLFSIARNLSLKHFRDNRTEEIDAAPAAASDPSNSLPMASAVARVIGDLPELQRESLILFEYEGCTLEEIAHITGADTGTIKARLHRARANLRRTLAPIGKAGNRCGTV